MSAALLRQTGLSVVNVGVEMFAQSVQHAGGQVLQVDWQPPGDGDAELAWTLALLASDDGDPATAGARIDADRRRAVRR